MIDAPATLHDYLSAQTALTALTSTRIWAETDAPPPGYKPSTGAGLVFWSRTGTVDFSSQLLRSTWWFKCYGEDASAANTLYRTLVDVLHDGRGYGVRGAQLVASGQTLREPDEPRWVFVLAIFETVMLSAIAA